MHLLFASWGLWLFSHVFKTDTTHTEARNVGLLLNLFSPDCVGFFLGFFLVFFTEKCFIILRHVKLLRRYVIVTIL